MLFGTTKSSTSATNSANTSSDIYTVACDLQSQLHDIEEWFTKGQETNRQLKDQKNELKEALRLFEIIEENEVNLTNELERELEEALQGMSYEEAAEIRLDPDANLSSILENSRFCAQMRGTMVADKENAFVHARPPNTQSSLDSNAVFYAEPQRPFRPRVVIPPRWKKVIALSVASALKDRQPPASKTVRTSGSGPDSWAPGSMSTTGPHVTDTACLGNYSSAAAEHLSGSADTVSLASTGALCGGGSCRPKAILHASKSSKVTKKKRSLEQNWTTKPYKARRQSKATHPLNTLDASPGPKREINSPAVRRMGLGSFGGQWNATANSALKVDPEDEHRFNFMMSV